MAEDPKDPQRKPTGAPPNEDKSAGEGRRSGRVTFDSRGNSVWEWQLETGVYSRDVSTHKLRKLYLGDLSIAETAIQRSPLAPEKDAAAPGGGFNPYNSAPRSKQPGFNPYDNARSVSEKLKLEEPPRRRPLTLDELRKLSEEIKRQRAADRDKKK